MNKALSIASWYLLASLIYGLSGVLLSLNNISEFLEYEQTAYIDFGASVLASVFYAVALGLSFRTLKRTAGNAASE